MCTFSELLTSEKSLAAAAWLGAILTAVAVWVAYQQLSNLVKDQRARFKSERRLRILAAAHEMFEARDIMNAKVHCSPVRLSPITERVAQALAKYRAQKDG